LRIRELRLDDYADVVAVLVRNGLRKPTPQQWAYLWNATPHPKELANIPAGWVLLHDGDGVVGTFRNISILYEWNRRPVRIAIASAWAVDAAHRRHSLMLAGEYFKQTNADVLLNMTAVAETSGKAFLAFRADRVPQPTYTTRMLWITGYRGFAANLVRERGLPGVLEYPAALTAWLVDVPRRGARKGDGVRAAAGFDDRFDRLWAAMRDRRDRLQAVRDVATLTWRFALERVPPLIAVLMRGGELAAYAILVRRDQGDLRRLEVADLQALDDDPALVQAVMAGALRLAREQGIHLVALSGHNDAKRRALHGSKPHVKTTAGWPLYYKAVDASLAEGLRSPTAWDLSLFDSDGLWSAMFERGGQERQEGQEGQ
jgi:hypothetical protein